MLFFSRFHSFNSSIKTSFKSDEKYNVKLEHKPCLSSYLKICKQPFTDIEKFGKFREKHQNRGLFFRKVTG